MNEFNSDIENKDDAKRKEYISKRTLNEVFDVKEGKFINADEFFKRDEAEIMAFRRHLEEAIALNEPRFICPYCKQMIKICGRRTSNHRAVYFSHLYDSDDCEKKTTTQLSADYILAKKYGMIQESERHKRLKNLLAYYLQTEKCKRLGFSNVQVSKRINSNIPYLNWRCPDVYVEFNGKKIVFELQLSTYFLSVLVARDIFYRLNGYYIIWVFNFDNNYITQESLFTKDTYYSNKRNVFIFDEKAQQKCKDEDMLYLDARYLDKNNNLSDAQLISMFDLKFDETTYKPYFYNAETEYYQLHPEVLKRIQELERSTEEFHIGLMRRQQEEEEKKKLIEEKSAQMREHMKACGGVATLYKSGRRFGYKYESTILTEAKYTFAEEIGKSGFAIVKNNSKFGIVNQYGEEIMSCVCKEILNLGNGLYLMNYNREWTIWNKEISLERSKAEDTVSIFNINNRISAFNITRAGDCIYSMVINREASQYVKCKFVSKYSDNLYTIDYGNSEKEYVTNFGHIFKQESPFNNNVIIANNYFKRNLYGLLNSEYLAISAFKYTNINFFSESAAKVMANEKIGIITYSNQQKRFVDLIPCIYDRIQPINNRYYLVNNDGRYGIIETTDIDKINPYWETKDKFAEVVPCIYEQISLLQNEYYIVQNDGKFGLIRIKPYNDTEKQLFSVIIPCIYESIQHISEKYFIVKQESKYGVINDSNETIIQPKYDSIKLSDDDTFYVKSGNKTGHFDLNGNVLTDIITTINDTYSIGCLWGDFGILNADKSAALSFKYKDIHCLNEHIIVAMFIETNNSEDWFSIVQNIEHIELYDYNLNRLLGDLDIASINALSNDNFRIRLFDGTQAVLSSTGTLIKEDMYEISDSLIKYKLFGHWGIINLAGDCVQPNIWDNINVLNNKNILIYKRDSVNILSPDGQVISEITGKTFDSMLTNDIIKLRDYTINISKYPYLRQSSPFDLYTTTGERICENCLNTQAIDDDKILYKYTPESGTRFGLINAAGEKVLPEEYESLDFSFNNFIIAKGEDNCFVYDKDYRQIFESQGFVILNKNLIAVKPKNSDNGKWGIVDLNFKFVMPTKYDRISRLSDNWILLEYGEKMGCISSDFTKVYPCRFINMMVNRMDQPMFWSKNKWILCSNYMSPNRLEINTTHTGEVIKILPFGIVLKMPNNDTILVHISEIKNRGRTIDSYSLHDLVNIRVKSFDIATAKYRFNLT